MSNYIEVHHLRHWATPIVSFTADKFLAWQETEVDVLPRLWDAFSKPIKEKKSPDDKTKKGCETTKSPIWTGM